VVQVHQCMAELDVVSQPQVYGMLGLANVLTAAVQTLTTDCKGAAGSLPPHPGKFQYVPPPLYSVGPQYKNPYPYVAPCDAFHYCPPQQFPVVVSVYPNPITPGNKVTVTGYSVQGAKCSAGLELTGPSGTTVYLGAPLAVDSSGMVEWLWTATVSGVNGQAFVSCFFNGVTVTATTQVFVA
jgi:hypothetical protein